MNPSSNALPKDISQETFDSVISQSGYPLQQVVGAIFEKHNFAIRHEWAFKDFLTETIRTADIMASKDLYDWRDSPRVRPRLNIIIECKKSRYPYAFFLTQNEISSTVFPLVAGSQHPRIVLQSSEPGVGLLSDAIDVTGLKNHKFLKECPAQSLNFTRINRDGRKVTVSSELPYKDLLLPLVSAMRSYEKLVAPTKKDLPYTDLHIVLGLAVIDAPLMGVEVTTEGHTSEPVPWVRVMRHEPFNETEKYSHDSMVYAIDVIHKDYLNSYLQDWLLPFSQQFGVEAQDKQEVIHTGQGILDEAADLALKNSLKSVSKDFVDTMLSEQEPK